MGKNQHVIPWGHQQWAVRGEGNCRITSCHPTQKAAFLAARRIAVSKKNRPQNPNFPRLNPRLRGIR